MSRCFPGALSAETPDWVTNSLRESNAAAPADPVRLSISVLQPPPEPELPSHADFLQAVVKLREDIARIQGKQEGLREAPNHQAREALAIALKLIAEKGQSDRPVFHTVPVFLTVKELDDAKLAHFMNMYPDLKRARRALVDHLREQGASDKTSENRASAAIKRMSSPSAK